MVRPKGGQEFWINAVDIVSITPNARDVIDGPCAGLWLPELLRPRHQQGGLRDDAIGILRPFAHPTSCLARVDHFLHLEPVERPYGSSRAFDTRIDLGSQCCWIGGLG